MKKTKTARIQDLLALGKSQAEIAKSLKVSSQLVSKVARKTRENSEFVSKVFEKVKGVPKRPKSVAKKIHDIRAASWAAANPWFGVDEDKTVEALKYHEKLIEAGFDPYTDKYWDRVEMRFNGKPKARMMSAVEETKEDLDSLKPGAKVGGLTLTKVGNKSYKWVRDDTVNHPPHYRAGGIETIDFIEAKDFNYRLGNVVKYVSRAGKKDTDPLEDLKKAAWYLEREISARERA